MKSNMEEEKEETGLLERMSDKIQIDVDRTVIGENAGLGMQKAFLGSEIGGTTDLGLQKNALGTVIRDHLGMHKRGKESDQLVAKGGSRQNVMKKTQMMKEAGEGSNTIDDTALCNVGDEFVCKNDDRNKENLEDDKIVGTGFENGEGGGGGGGDDDDGGGGDPIGDEIDEGGLEIFFNLVELVFTRGFPNVEEASTNLRAMIQNHPDLCQALASSEEHVKRLHFPLQLGNVAQFPVLQENCMTIVHRFSHYLEFNTSFLNTARNGEVMIKSLRFGTDTTKENSSSSLILLAEYPHNKIIIGNMGGIKFFVELLQDEREAAWMRTSALRALQILFGVAENVRLGIAQGVVPLILKLLQNDGFSTIGLLGILSDFSKVKEASIQLRERDDEVAQTLLRFISIITDEEEGKLIQEKAIEVLFRAYSIPFPRFNNCNFRLQAAIRSRSGAISKLAANGSEQAKRTARLFIESVALWYEDSRSK